jgi:hypothetical protein
MEEVGVINQHSFEGTTGKFETFVPRNAQTDV